jgi:tetrahydromethanopterin S-methyltransferase subunit B
MEEEVLTPEVAPIEEAIDKVEDTVAEEATEEVI